MVVPVFPAPPHCAQIGPRAQSQYPSGQRPPHDMRPAPSHASQICTGAVCARSGRRRWISHRSPVRCHRAAAHPGGSGRPNTDGGARRSGLVRHDPPRLPRARGVRGNSELCREHMAPFWNSGWKIPPARTSLTIIKRLGRRDMRSENRTRRCAIPLALCSSGFRSHRSSLDADPVGGQQHKTQASRGRRSARRRA